LTLQAGAKWIKTSTGFVYRGATIEDVRLLKKELCKRGYIKASGGICDFGTAMAMVKAGASRIGTSHGVTIMQQYRRSLKTRKL